MRKGNDALSPSLASLRARELAQKRWAKVKKPDRIRHAEMMNDAALRKWQEESGGDESQAKSAQRAHLMKAAQKSIEVRQAKNRHPSKVA